MRGLCLLLTATLAWAQEPARTIAFTHVTVIDTAAGTSEPDMTVVVKGDRVVDAGRSTALKPPDKALIVDAKGKYLTPGLWDMHAHFVQRSVSIYLANGVTGVRDMADDIDQVRKLRDQVASGEVIGPRIYFCGPHVDGPSQRQSGNLIVKTPQEGRDAVDNLKKQGAEFIKVYTNLSREVYFAIAGEAKRQQLPFAGHVPISITAAEASDAGQKSIEHPQGILLGCAKEGADLRSTRGAIVTDYDPERANALFEKLAKNGTWYTPTFAVMRTSSYWNDPETRSKARIEYLPAALRDSWAKSPFTQLMNGIPPSAAEVQHQVFELSLQIAGRMHRAGVGILAGTDSGIPYVVQGFSLHDELYWLVKAGLSPMEALRSATLRPAEYFGITGSSGSIGKGKLADLVLLNADPLQDIANTRKIEAVMAAGHLLTRADLDRMLEKLRAE